MASRGFAAYIRQVVDFEWPLLAEERSPPLTRAELDQLRHELQRFREANPDHALVPSIRDDIDQLGILRSQRNLDATEELDTLFWLTSIAGYTFTVLCFFVNRPTVGTCSIISMFAAINGMVMYAIFSLSHPYAIGVSIEPAAFEMVIERTINLQ